MKPVGVFAFFIGFFLLYFRHVTDTLQNTEKGVAGLYSGDPVFLYVVGHP